MVSVSLLFFREPILHLFQGKHKLFPDGVATGIMGGIVEILEILLGFLANTVSFIRVAAFGLAHAGLFMAIFALADAVQGIAGGAVSVLVLIFGNVGIIALEGLVVTIQAVRLEFYEFFSRFFEQGSTSYRPLSTELEGV
jgi:V/A-type H+-transporting ATPase subunit I